MSTTGDRINRRILVIDDNTAIHEDFRKTLTGHEQAEALATARSLVFDETLPKTRSQTFEVDCVNQGQTGLALAQHALQHDRPYAMAFVDMRMPPGWDGIETIEHLWQVDPELQVVICTAFTDHAWLQILERLGHHNENLLILRKPFDLIEVQQLANSLTSKRHLAHQAALRLADLATLVEQRTRELRDANTHLQQDIARRKAAEEQLAQTAHELTLKNQELAQKNEELSQARDQALASVRVKAEFLAIMSHELRTPLNIILGYTSLLLDETFGRIEAEQLTAMQRIDRSANELLDLITSVLDLSRLEAGRLSLDLIQVQVTQVLQQLQLETRTWQEQASPGVVWQVGSQLPAIHTDPGKLKVVVKNLLSNAIKFTPDGQVTVSAYPSEGGVTVSVADTGIGMPPEALSVIFEPFRQLDSSDARRYGGAGLGLHIVKRLLTVLGGTITVESEEGRGSTFRVWFPTYSGATQDKERCERHAALPASSEVF